MSAGTEREPVLRLDDIDVHFDLASGLFAGNDDTVRAVDGVSLDIYENDVVALVGESGCGKTTLGKTAIGLQRPTGGAVTYRGQDVWDAKDGTGTVNIAYERIRRALQIIHQDPGSSMNPNRTVKANLAVPLKKYRPDMGQSAREQTIHKLLSRLGIEPPEAYANRFPHQLSGGEQQRIVLGRSLLMQPDLILADEAVSALDVSLRVDMMDLLLDLRELFDTAYLMISHDFANARYIAKKADGKIGVMYLGKLVEIGPVDEVLENPKHPYTKVLVWSSPSLDPDTAAKETMEQPPVRDIDIPDPQNPPPGCKFNTRCEQIIPPDGLNIDQGTYNDVVDLRQAIENETLEVESVIYDVTGGVQTSVLDDEVEIDEFATAVRERYFDRELGDPHRSRVHEALKRVAVDEWDEAAADLREHYESICEQSAPELRDDHPVACYLYDGPLPTDGDSGTLD